MANKGDSVAQEACKNEHLITKKPRMEHGKLSLYYEVSPLALEKLH